MATSKGCKYGTGALPPPEMAWVMGKTAASIWFVRDAENLLAVAGTSVAGGPVSEQDIELLRNAIAAVKAGKLEFKEETTARTWLEHLKKQKHPIMGKGVLPQRTKREQSRTRRLKKGIRRRRK